MGVDADSHKAGEEKKQDTPAIPVATEKISSSG
jgi:hypothetical protein